MDDLGVALRRLAGTATAPGVADPAVIWKQGRARVRRHRAAAVVLAAVVLGVLSGLSTYVAVPTTAVVPANAPHEPAVPRNIWPAPNWIPSTADAGPLGQVAAMAPHGTYPHESRFIVSATTGEYRLLVLPDYLDFDSEVQMQLAPDGNHIAYWYQDRDRPKTKQVRRPTGLALYDTRTGAVKRWKIVSPAGTEFAPYGTQSILWVDSDRVAASWVFDSGDTKSVDANFVWEIDRPAPTRVVEDLPPMANVGPPNTSGQVLGLLPDDARRYGFIGHRGLPERDTAISVPGDGEYISYVRVTREGRTVLAGTAGGIDDAVQIGHLSGGGSVRKFAPVDVLRDSQVLGWIDADNVLAIGPSSADDDRQALFNVDLRDLTAVRLGTASGNGNEDVTNSGGTPHLQIATDLLGEPMVKGTRPSRTDPRLRLAVLVAAATAAFVVIPAGFVLTRRRRRA